MQSHHHSKNPIPISIRPNYLMNYPMNSPQLIISCVDSEEEKPKFNDDDEYLNNIPPGYKFRPSDEELIIEYLLKKINNEVLPPNRMNTARLYDFSPDTLAGSFKASGENEWYFFTPRERKYKNGARPDRAAADGYWRASTADRPIIHNGEEIGYQKALVFFRGTFSNSTKTHWLMHEFRAKNALAAPRTTQENSMRLDDWVLCKVYKNTSTSGKKRKKEEANDDTAHSCRQPNSPMYPCNQAQGHDVALEECSRLHVESTHHPISGQRSLISSTDGGGMSSFPYDHRQGPGLASELDNESCTIPSHFRGDHTLYVEYQGFSPLHVESSYPIPPSSFSSSGVGLLSFPYYDHLQGPSLASQSVNGMAIYPSHFQTIEQARSMFEF